MAHMTMPCWKWLAYINHDGYGNFSFSGRMGGSHRFSYQLHIGPIPEGMEVRHTCHNPACSNPEHLELGSHIDNMHDLALSGRRKGFRVKYRRPPKYKPTLEERFWNKVNKDGPTMPHMDSPCWVWIAGKHNSFGHGSFHLRSTPKKTVLAHRFSWELSTNLPIPIGMDVLHHCDNPSCVNPDHLFLGTHTDNMHDMILKGRLVPLKGEKNGMSKFTQEQVDEMRYRYLNGETQVSLAKELDVTQPAISAIITYKNWKD